MRATAAHASDYGPFAGSSEIDIRYAEPPGQRRFERENFSFEMPGSPWAAGPPTVNGGELRITLVCEETEIAVVVIAAPVGVESGIDAQSATNALRHEMQTRFSDLTSSLALPESNNGIPGLRCQGDMSIRGHELHMSCWTAVHNGFSYQVIAFGPPANAAATNAASWEMCQRLHSIDLSRVHHVEGQTLVRQYESTRYGYRIDLTNLGWVTSPELSQIREHVDFIATRKLSLMFVTPIPLPGRNPGAELLGKLMLARKGLSDSSADVKSATAAQFGAMPAREYVLSDSHAPNQLDVIRVAATQHLAYVVMGRVAGGDEADVTAVRQAMDRIIIDPNFRPANMNFTDAEKETHSLFLNDMGILAHRQGDLPAALDYFTSANSLNVRDEAMLVNRLDTLSELNRRAEAIAIAEQQLAQFPASEPLRITYARLLAKDGRPADARQIFRQLFLAGCVDEDALTEYTTLAGDTGAHDEAIEVVAAYAARKPSIKNRTLLASLHLKKRDFETAIAQLQQLQREYPDDVDTATILAFAYEEAERYDETLQVTQPLIDDGCRDELIWILHCRTQLRLEKYAEAKHSLERAAELIPTSEPIRELLKTASSMLGQGDNSSLKKAIAPVEIPTVVRTAIEQTQVQPNQLIDRYGAEELVRITGISYRRGQPTRTSTSCRIKIHTAAAVAQYSTLTFELSPSAERLYVNRLAVLDSSGSVVAEGNVDNYYVVDDDSSGLATNAKVVNIPVPALKPGHTIEYMITREEKGLAEEFSFQRVSLASTVPVAVSVLYVEGDVQQLRCATTQQLKFVSSGNVLHCIQVNTLAATKESNQQSQERFLPIVWIGDVATQWDVEAKSYLEFMSEKLTLDEATRTLAASLTKDCVNNRAKLAVLASYVQSSCTYQGIEFGRRGRLPNSAAQTLELHYGDCKDHAVLLKQLLAAVGIQSHLAVVSSDTIIAESVPSLDQFDHMILFVPNESLGEPAAAAEGLVIDNTQKDSNPLLSPPAGLADKSVLVLDPAKPRFIRTPAYPADALQLTSRRRVVVREAGNSRRAIEAAVAEEITLNAYMSPGLRGYLRSVEAGKRRETLQELLASGQHVRITRADVENLDDTSLPLVLHLEYVMPDAFQRLPSSRDGGMLVGRLPVAWETRLLEADYLDRRETPFEIRMPRLVRTEVRIDLPTGCELADLERWNGSGQTKFVAWVSQTQASGSTVTLNHAVRVPAGRYRAADYETYYADMKDSLSVLQLPVMLREPVREASTASGTLRR